MLLKSKFLKTALDNTCAKDTIKAMHYLILLN